MGFVCGKQMFHLQCVHKVIKVPSLANLHLSKSRGIIMCCCWFFVPDVGRHKKGESNNSCKGLCARYLCLCYRNLVFSCLFCDVTYLTNAYFEGSVIKIFIMDNYMGVCVRRRLGSKKNLYPNLLMNYLTRFFN